MKEQKKETKSRRPLLLFTFGLGCLLLLISFLLRGKNIALFNPQGEIAQEQYNLLVYTLGVLLAVLIPTLLILFFVARKYRETNSTHSPLVHVRSNKLLVVTMWLVPTLVMLLLARVMIPATHKLAPMNAIASDTKPLTIQVVSLRWKWLFIYPEQNIATVNFIQVPVNTPVTFELTADESPMSSFWIPNLGGQLYAMTGHVNRLNLMATSVGDYPGSSAEINGDGFAGMRFTAKASSSDDFDRWVDKVRHSPHRLDSATYEDLLEPSQYDPVMLYSSAEPSLYGKVVTKYTGSSEGHGH